MSGTFKLVTLVGTSDRSFAEAAQTAVKDAAASLRGLSWFEVKELRGKIKDGNITEYQATLEVGFKVEV
ncbi:MAG TPA: dodecin [Candidatus Polarisedimenticolaceae bacterium]|nr:dodecin [Candidatus Polarisedimenticolaceae bacterium]